MLVIVFLENFFTNIKLSVFVSVNESIIFYLGIIVLNLQGSQRVLHRWYLK